MAIGLEDFDEDGLNDLASEFVQEDEGLDLPTVSTPGNLCERIENCEDNNEQPGFGKDCRNLDYFDGICTNPQGYRTCDGAGGNNYNP